MGAMSQKKSVVAVSILLLLNDSCNHIDRLFVWARAKNRKKMKCFWQTNRKIEYEMLEFRCIFFLAKKKIINWIQIHFILLKICKISANASSLGRKWNVYFGPKKIYEKLLHFYARINIYFIERYSGCVTILWIFYHLWAAEHWK